MKGIFFNGFQRKWSEPLVNSPVENIFHLFRYKKQVIFSTDDKTRFKNDTVE